MGIHRMKLFKILLRYSSTKDSVEVVERYVIAYTDQDILDRLIHPNSHFNGASGVWKDRHEEDGLWNIEDSNHCVIGQETYFERMLRLRGEFHDPKVNYDDKFYGIRHWGWTEGIDISEDKANILLEMNIAEDWRF